MTKKSLRKLRFSDIAGGIAFFVFFTAPWYASAFWTFGQPLVPCGGGRGAQACDFNAVIKLLNNIIDLGVQIAPLLAAIAFTFAGFAYVTAGGDESKIGKAHEMFMDTVVGLVIVLAAYFIVKTILVGLDVAPWANLLT